VKPLLAKISQENACAFLSQSINKKKNGWYNHFKVALVKKSLSRISMKVAQNDVFASFYNDE